MPHADKVAPDEGLRRSALDPARPRSAAAAMGAGPSGLAQRALIQSIDQSPRMVAQRRQIAQAFGASAPAVAQKVDLPKDSVGKAVGSLETMQILKDDKPITGQALQTALIQELKKTGQSGFGYRLVTLLYNNGTFTKDDRKTHFEPHGMIPWPVDIGPNLGDISLLVRGTLNDSGQLTYLEKNGVEIGKTHEVIVDVDWYLDRNQGDVGFHKDSRGTTLFVNLTYDNEKSMQGASTKPDYEGQPQLEDHLPPVVKEDLLKRRQEYGDEDPNAELDEREMGPYARVSFSDPSVWHSTPLLRHRLEKLKPAEDVGTLEERLVGAGFAAHLYRGILACYGGNEASAVFEHFVPTAKPKTSPVSWSSLQSELALHGFGDDAWFGLKSKYSGVNDFWTNYIGAQGIDKYNRHGISKEIQPVNGSQLTAKVLKRGRRLSRKLNKDPELQDRLNEEAKRPRTFIRTWVRLIKKTAG